MPLGSCGGASGASWMKPRLRAPSWTLCGLWHSVQVNQRFLPVLAHSPMRLAMDAIAPVTHLVAMALATQQLWLVKADRIAKVVHQFVALGGVVAVQAPDAFATMLQILKIRDHGCHGRNRGGFLARRQFGRIELGANTVMTGCAAHRHQGEFLGAWFDNRVAWRNLLKKGHIADRDSAIEGVAPPENRPCFGRTLHVGPAGCRSRLTTSDAPCDSQSRWFQPLALSVKKRKKRGRSRRPGSMR
jgi:hypothetical protein